jgi:uncharacterized protein
MATIWVDADACPVPVKEILFRAAERVGMAVTLVANQPIKTPPSKYIRSVVVAKTFDAADHYIAEHLEVGDLVITQDIPLAAEVVELKATALNPRGELYTEANIRERLNMRDMMEDLRSSGMVSGGPSAFGQRERQSFANALDRFLAQAR